LLTQIANYMAIVGLEDFNGINFGPTEPSESNRDKPWFQTDSSGNPIGWFAWNGSAWAPIPQALPFGPTASRPVSPSTGTEYFDTDINTALVYERSQWRTLAGTPGDVKEVKAASLAAALLSNPGWAHDTDSVAKVVAGAATDGSNYGLTQGSDQINLEIAPLPAHTHTTQGRYGSGGEGGADDPTMYDAAQPTVALQAWPDTGSTGSGAPVDVRQNTIYYWRLVKQ